MALQREQVVQAAEKYVSRGKIEPAIREYKKLLSENPNDINTLNRVGDLYARIQRIDEAVDFFTQIGERYTTEGFFVKAIAIYKKIIKLDPTRLEVYERLAELYHKQGLVTEARTQYQVLADYYQKHENAASAIAIYQKMALLEPENPTYHVKLAEIYHQQHLTEKAMGEYRIIAELMIAHGRPQEAARVYERALDIDAGNLGFVAEALMRLREAGETAAAARLLAVALERNPEAERLARGVAAPEPEPATGHGVALAPEPHGEDGEGWTAPVLTTGDLLLPVSAFDAGDLGRPEPEHPEEIEPPAPRSGPAPGFAGAAPGTESTSLGEIDLDLDEVFVLDFDDEEPPASMVQPPPDMLEAGPRRPAWSQSGVHQAPAAPAPADEAIPGFGAGPAASAPFSLGERDEPGSQLGSAATGELLELPAELPEIDLEVDLGDLGDLGADLGAPAAGDSPSVELLEEESFELGLDLADHWGLTEGPEADPALPAAGAGVAEPALAAEPEPAAAEPQPPPQLRIDPDLLERTAAELHPEAPPVREEDLVTEAEVLAKYGLEEKALERLREALRLNPSHLDAHALLVQIHLDKGRHGRVVELANQMAAIAARARSDEPWQRLKRRLAAAGFRLEGERVVGVPAARPEKTGTSVDDLLRGIIDAPAAKRPAKASTAPVSAGVPPAVPSPEPRPAAAPPTALAGPPPPAPVAPMAAAPPVPPGEPSAAPGPPSAPSKVTFDLRQIGAEVEMEDEDVLAGPAAPPAAASPPTAAAPASLDDSGGLSWLDEAEARRPAAAKGDRLFDHDDFFDLAGQLEHELTQEGFAGEELLVQPAEQSLEEIVEGFKRGVAESLSPTDYDTHFNLGIAYREMGLLDEAIGEFQLSSKSPDHLVSCCSMLGLCFLDKGLPELAVKWYKRGLEAPRLSEEDNLGLLYDLGTAYLAMGDEDTAYKTFVEVYGINTNYRDVVARIEELGRPR